MTKYANRLFLSVVFLATILAHQLYALELDPNLNTLCLNRTEMSATPCGEAVQPDVGSFKNLMTAYGLALAPPNLTPANTLGINATSFNLAYGVVGNPFANAPWANATSGKQASPTLMNANLMVRKGLPYSFELEGSLGYMINTELFAVGGGIRWALHEAVKLVPVDFSVRFNVRKVMGSSQIDMTTTGLDFSLGHEFGILKLFSIAPYIAYSPMWIYANSNVLDATPGTFNAPALAQSNARADSFVFAQQTIAVQRFTVGARFLIGVLQLIPEATFSGNQSSYFLNLGLRI